MNKLLDIKKLGFGLMRLPKKADVIDIGQTKKMVDMFLKAGFTYFDTAWAYPGSEEAIKAALVDRYPRDAYTLATKNAAWINCKSREDALKQFETSLERTGAGYFDFYLLHNLGEHRSKFFDDFDLWNWAQQQKKAGLIKNVGFSFHSTAEELDDLLNKHPEVDFVQLQINYADWDNPAIQSRACYEVARKHQKPIVIMEPVKGGNLANPPQPVASVFDTYGSNNSYASWAIRFAAGLEGVITVLSGMSNVEQMQDNLSFMQNFESLNNEEKEILKQAQAALAQIPLIPCTNCNYCAKVCPNNIGISGSFTAMNLYTLYHNESGAKSSFNWQVNGHGKNAPSQCIKCGACEQVCPQHIAIRDELVKVSTLFEK